MIRPNQTTFSCGKVRTKIQNKKKIHYILFMWVCKHMSHDIHVEVREFGGSWFYLSTTWVPGTECMSSDLAVSAFAGWATSLDPKLRLFSIQVQRPLLYCDDFVKNLSWLGLWRPKFPSQYKAVEYKPGAKGHCRERTLRRYCFFKDNQHLKVFFF